MSPPLRRELNSIGRLAERGLRGFRRHTEPYHYVRLGSKKKEVEPIILRLPLHPRVGEGLPDQTEDGTAALVWAFTHWHAPDWRRMMLSTPYPRQQKRVNFNSVACGAGTARGQAGSSGRP